MIKSVTNFKFILFVVLLACSSSFIETYAAEKNIYVPSSFGSMNLNSSSSKWSYSRSRETDNFIVFWEAGYGTNPKTTSNSSYRVDVDALLTIAEKSFVFYRDSLKFISEGNSKTDQYKMVILLFYTTTWEASGSGVDDMIGLLNLSANAAQALGVTIAHEVGHCFQYQVHCDGFPGGWMYGFGANTSGGNCWWEQCAQWQAFKVLPNEQFSNYRFSEYLSNAHRNILHESPRYANYFIQDYWTMRHGMDFIGYLWQMSKSPEDPVQAYKRLTGISQSAFNDEIYDCASRFVTWDIPALKALGKNYIDARGSSNMSLTDENYWIIDPSDCVQNYGYNVIKLNVPDTDSVAVYFEGKMNEAGYRMPKGSYYSGWRYGLVALTKDGNRTYSDMRAPRYKDAMANPTDTLTFACPENCDKLWLVVTGAPTLHWRHPWDDDESNDEQWPYQVKFKNTNLYGSFDFSDDDTPTDITLTQNLTLKPVTVNSNPYPSTSVQPDLEQICRALKLQLPELKSKIGSSVRYCAITPSGTKNYSSTANAPGHWFNKNGSTTTWGNSSYIFSELKQSSLTFSIGQYPNLCKEGDQITIKQGLVYTPSTGSVVTVTLVFNITISAKISTDVDTHALSEAPSVIKGNIVTDILHLRKVCKSVIVFDMYGKEVGNESNTKVVDVSRLAAGIYLVVTDGRVEKIIKE